MRFDWRDGQGIVVPAERAHLVVTLRRTAERTHEVPPGALAALHRMRRFYGQAPLPGRPDAVIVVALDRVERLAADAVARERSAPARAVAARLSVLLGRVVAHEIGHYLLESGEHTGYGLMRAAYGAGDTTCAPDYGLDSAQTARVRSLWWQRASAEVIIAAR